MAATHARIAFLRIQRHAAHSHLPDPPPSPPSLPPSAPRPSAMDLDPELGFTNHAPPGWLYAKLSATCALLTWPAVATGRLVSSIWHISHAAWNKLQHSIHGNGATLPHQRPAADQDDPFFYAFAGRNLARTLHNSANASTTAANTAPPPPPPPPPPARRANPHRHPAEHNACARGVPLTRAAHLCAADPLTQGALLDRIVANFYVSTSLTLS